MAMTERELEILNMPDLEWKLHVDRHMQAFDRRLTAEEIARLEDSRQLHLNTQITTKVYDNTLEIVSLYTSAQTTTKLLARFGNFIATQTRKWAPVVAAAAAIWAWWHGGGDPPKGGLK